MGVERGLNMKNKENIKNIQDIQNTTSKTPTKDTQDDEPIFTEEERLRMWQLIFDFYGGRGRDEDE